MAFDFHTNTEKYWNIQVLGAQKSIIPFLRSHNSLSKGMRVLEVGSHIGGNLLPFINEQHHCTGIEIEEHSASKSKQYLHSHIESGNARIVHQDIFKVKRKELGKPFDVIILKDSIEHIFDQEKLLSHLDQYLSPKGSIFISFPPWQMPFGGHQQGAQAPLISKWAWLHLLPSKICSSIIKKMGETDTFHDYVMQCRETGISIDRFEEIVRRSAFTIKKKESFFIAPIYKYKFGLPELKQPKIFSSIPYIRNFYTTAVYYILQK